jgi:putative ABC transport system ATP-binding protein
MNCRDHPLILENVGAAAANGALGKLVDLSYRFRAGALHGLFGSSSGGKSLLLQVLSGRAQVTAGRIILDGHELVQVNPVDQAEILAKKTGYLFAGPLLLPDLTILENVAMPLFKLTSVGAEEARSITEELLALTSLRSLADVLARNVSPFEQCRTALARAVVHQPRLLVCFDLGEQLDDPEREGLLTLVRQLCQRMQIAALATFSREPAPGNIEVALTVEERIVREEIRMTPHG